MNHLLLLQFVVVQCFSIHYFFVVTNFLLVFLLLGLHVQSEVDDAVGVAKLVVIPRDQFDECVGELNPSFGVEDGGPVVAQEVRGNDLIFGVAKDPLHLALRILLYLGADLIVRRLLTQTDR